VAADLFQIPTSGALLLPQELMQLPEKDMIVLRLGIPPVYGRKIRFYEEKDMVALTQIAAHLPTIRPDPTAATSSLPSSRRPKGKITPAAAQDRRRDRQARLSSIG
jgi:type IV secretory pathway TraG/TraD family ATPase VirD4